MSPLIDSSRIAQLKSALGTDFEEIVNELVLGIEDGIEQIESALDRGELDQAARAAHTARNDAVLVHVEELMRSLEDVEQSSRVGKLAHAREALARVRSAWPPARAELEQLRTGPGA